MELLTNAPAATKFVRRAGRRDTRSYAVADSTASERLLVVDPGRKKMNRRSLTAQTAGVPAARRRERRTAAEPIEDTVPARILLAEDDPAMRAMVARSLRREGYEVCEVKDGSELLKRLADRMLRPSWDVDLIVSGVRMPGKTGIDVLAGLRQSDWSMPVILITAFGDEALHTEAKRLGAAKILDKPFDLEELTDAVRSIVPPALPN